jgi:hypothetical protein
MVKNPADCDIKRHARYTMAGLNNARIHRFAFIFQEIS